jgi:hypothetical protein
MAVPPRRSIKELLAEAARELKAPDPDEITARHDLAELHAQVQEVRHRQPSTPEFHIHTTHATPAPQSSDRPKIAIDVPGGVKLRASGSVVVIIVAAFAGVSALVWLLTR